MVMILLLVSYCMLSPALERGEEFDDLTSEADNMTSEATHAAPGLRTPGSH